MKLEEAYEIVKVSPEEEGSIKRYLGFQHTGMNILADLTPENYRNLNKSGWKLPETEKEIKDAIQDFVNIYAAMYKESKGKKVQRTLVRGTSGKHVPKTGEEIYRMLSTSTDESVAKTFCKYGNAALIRVAVQEGVPFLDVDNYRDENRADEKEIILPPFCKVSKSVLTSEYDGYAYYDITIGKSELLEMSEEDIENAMNDVIQGFSQNIEDMQTCVELSDTYENLTEKIKNAKYDREEQNYWAKEREKSSEEYYSKTKKTSEFKEKLRRLLKGLCRKKELEIDKAQEVVDTENRKKQEATREEIKQNMILEFFERKANLPKELAELQDVLINAQQGLMQSELTSKRVATFLKVPYNAKNSITVIQDLIKNIQENMKKMQQKISENQLLREDSFETVDTTIRSINPIFDSVTYGLKIAQDIPDIVLMYQEQADNSVKQSLYRKVQKAIQEARIKKCLEEKEAISSEKKSFWGRITGKNDLQEERLNNVNLKIQLARATLPQEQGNCSIRDMLVDLYVCSIVETGGEFTPDMQQLYDTIKKAYPNPKYGKFKDEYIAKLARDKIKQTRGEELPILPSNKSFWGKNKKQAELLKLENERLSLKIKEANNKSPIEAYVVSGEDAISLLQTKLELIDRATIDESALRDRKNLIRTFDLFA